MPGWRTKTMACLITSSLFLGAAAEAAKPRPRDQVPAKYKWKVEDLYKSRKEWEKDLARLKRQVKQLEKCKGQLGRGVKRLAGCLDQGFDMLRRMYRLYGYASRIYDQDARQKEGQELKSIIKKVATDTDAAMSFIEPEILRIPEARLRKWMKSRLLADYRQYLDNIIRRRKHILPEPQERILAKAGQLASVPSDTYRVLTTVNMPYPEIKLSTGEQVKLTPAMYTRYRAVDNRADRLLVFQEFWKAHKAFRESLASLLAGQVNKDHFFADVRKYREDLEAALDENNVPTSIYLNMIKQVRAARPVLWRYLRLRAKMLGIKDLGYHDLYASIVPAVKMDVPYESARGILTSALAPLGDEYVKVLGHAFDQGWVDVYPTEGKRSGAYSDGSAYDVHPYILLNYNDDYESLSTLAHEFGHAMHSWLANKNQPFPMADYPIFVAEVASTTNENLLRIELLKKEQDKNRRMFLLGQHLENFRTTVFRQALFAEFELEIHRLAQKGVPLTADKLDELYLKLLREYYGEAEGVIKIDPLYAVEWAYIPHFYYNFYMFQYTTSFIAATSIAEKIASGDTRARDAYLGMLKAGGSKYPVQLLKMAGVDMTKSEPYSIAFEAMKKSIDELEKLAGR